MTEEHNENASEPARIPVPGDGSLTLAYRKDHRALFFATRWRSTPT